MGESYHPAGPRGRIAASGHAVWKRDERATSHVPSESTVCRMPEACHFANERRIDLARFSYQESLELTSQGTPF
jgi:hypothetical protein